jgi:hypothetical protein
MASSRSTTQNNILGGFKIETAPAPRTVKAAGRVTLGAP